MRTIREIRYEGLNDCEQAIYTIVLNDGHEIMAKGSIVDEDIPEHDMGGILASVVCKALLDHIEKNNLPKGAPVAEFLPDGGQKNIHDCAMAIHLAAEMFVRTLIEDNPNASVEAIAANAFVAGIGSAARDIQARDGQPIAALLTSAVTLIRKQQMDHYNEN